MFTATRLPAQGKAASYNVDGQAFSVRLDAFYGQRGADGVVEYVPFIRVLQTIVRADSLKGFVGVTQGDGDSLATYPELFVDGAKPAARPPIDLKPAQIAGLRKRRDDLQAQLLDVVGRLEALEGPPPNRRGR